MLLFGAVEFLNEVFIFQQAPVDTLPWLANPFLLISFLFLKKRWLIPFVAFSLISIYFASLYIGNPVGFCCEDGRHIPTEIRAGFWIWLLSLVVFLFQGIYKIGQRRLLPCLILSCIALSILSMWTAGLYLSKPERTIFCKTPVQAKNIWFSTKREKALSGWLIEAPSTEAIAVLMHGVRSNRGQMWRRAKHLRQRNISSLIFDFQAHGMSSGHRITMGYQGSLDAEAAIAYMQLKYPEVPLVVIGVSMGGAAMLLSDKRSSADVLILESVYPDLSTAISNRLNSRLAGAEILTPFLMFQFQLLGGTNAYSVSPIKNAQNVQGAKLIMAGENDKHTTINESKMLFEKFPDHKKLVVVPEAEHTDFERFDPIFYWTVVDEFLDQHLF